MSNWLVCKEMVTELLGYWRQMQSPCGLKPFLSDIT